MPRIVVIDLDVHQGNGTASIFADDPSVFTVSLHGEKNFPFRKAASDLDVGLPDGCGDADYLAALDAALAALWREHAARPFGLAFYLAGADPHEDDRLGRLKLTAAGLLERDRRVLAALRERRIPVALSMAGGYGHDIEVTVAIQAATIRAAIEVLAGMEECAAMNDSNRAASNEAAASTGRSRCRAPPTAASCRSPPAGSTTTPTATSTTSSTTRCSTPRSTAILIEAGALDIAAGEVIGYVVETHCNYFAPLAFPQAARGRHPRRPDRRLERALRDRHLRRRRGRRPRPAATSSTSTSIVRQSGRSPCPTA